MKRHEGRGDDPHMTALLKFFAPGADAPPLSDPVAIDTLYKRQDRKSVV